MQQNHEHPTILKPPLNVSDFYKLNQIKNSLLSILNQRKKNTTVQGQYRYKTNQIYRYKLKKVFHPLRMQEYQDMQNFKKYFPDYVDQTKKLKELLENNQPYTNQTIGQMNKKDIFDTILTLNLEQLSELEGLKANYKKQDLRDYEQNQQSLHIKKLPYINRNSSEKKKYCQSPLVFSPLRYCDKKNSTIEPLKRQNSNVSKINSILTLSNSTKIRRGCTNIENFYTSEKIIDQLNKINNLSHTVSNFKISIQQFSQCLIKRHGNQILSKYFNLPSTLTISKITELLNTIRQSSKKQQLMLMFLTLDLNKDGFICQDDMFKISSSIEVDSSLNKDFYKIAEYTKESYFKLPYNSELPKQFLFEPTREMYFKIFAAQQKMSLSNYKLPSISSKVQHFTIESPLSQRHQLSYENDDSNNESKKMIKISFRMFQEIFIDQECELLKDMLSFLLEDEYLVEKPSLIRLKRKFTLNHNAKFKSQSLQLRTSNKTLQSYKSQLSNFIVKGGKLTSKEKKIRYNTQEPTVLQKQIYKRSVKKHNPEKERQRVSILSDLSHLTKNSYESVCECSLCHAQIDKNRQYKYSERTFLPEELIQKINVFRNDKKSLNAAHYRLKKQQQQSKSNRSMSKS